MFTPSPLHLDSAADETWSYRRHRSNLSHLAPNWTHRPTLTNKPTPVNHLWSSLLSALSLYLWPCYCKLCREEWTDYMFITEAVVYSADGLGWFIFTDMMGRILSSNTQHTSDTVSVKPRDQGADSVITSFGAVLPPSGLIQNNQIKPSMTFSVAVCVINHRERNENICIY